MRPDKWTVTITCECTVFRYCVYWGGGGGGGGAHFQKHKTHCVADQAQKSIFKLNKYLYKFTFVSPKHKLELFDELISPILNYSGEVWGFCQANAIERVHMQFCKTND